MKVIIAGASDVGFSIASHFCGRTQDVVIIEPDQRVLERVDAKLDALVLHGHAVHRQSLQDSGVADAWAIYAASESDSENLVAAALARKMGARFSAARVDDPRFYETRLAVERDVLGVDAVFCSARVASHEMLSLLRAVDAVFVANMVGFAVQLVVLSLPHSSDCVTKRVDELSLPRDVSIRAVIRDGFLRSSAEIGPLEAGDNIVMTGPVVAMPHAYRRLGLVEQLQRVVVVGGGYTGAQLAHRLAAWIPRVQLIEEEPERCEELAKELPGVEVLRGDGANLEFLKDVQIFSADAFVAVAGEDEVNLMSALLAKHLGVVHTFTLVNHNSHGVVYHELGIEGVVSRSDALAKAMIAAMPSQGEVEKLVLPTSQHVLVEYTVPESLGKTRIRGLSDLPLPVHTHVLAGVRGGRPMVLSPTTALQVGDVLVVATLARHVSSLMGMIKG